MTLRSYTKRADREAAEAFLDFDADGSGAIDCDELGTLMSNLGIQLSPEEVQSWTSQLMAWLFPLLVVGFCKPPALIYPACLPLSAQLKNMMAEADISGGGDLSFDEFTGVL